MPLSAEVAVIGAGPCGLTACKALSERGIDYECFDAGSEAGGIWNVGMQRGGYRSLVTNTSNPNMAFADFPFEDGQASYLRAAEMAAYFRRYAEHFGVIERLRFDRRVARATAMPDGSWDLDFEDGEARSYSALVVATGRYSRPQLPHDSYPGAFDGAYLHVHDYFDAASPVDVRGKRVLVVGLGTSAAEVAAELSDPDNPIGCASQVILSARSGRWVLPKVFDSQPMDARAPRTADRPPGLLRWLPADAGSWLMRRFLAKSIRAAADSLGGFRALGLPEPAIRPWDERPTLSFDFIPALQAGRIDVRSGITRFDGATVAFADGTDAQVDVILYATGYGIDLPFLDRTTLGSDADDLALYRFIAHPVHDALFFIGYAPVMCSLWPVAEQQARWLARLLNGDFALPGGAVRTRRAQSLQQSLPVMCSMYVEELRREAGGRL